MGYNVSSIAMIGCRIDKHKLYNKVETPPCEHTIPDNANFCPECGVLNSPKEDYIAVADFDEDYNVDGFHFIRPNYYEEFFIVGRIVCTTGRDGNLAFLSSQFLNLPSVKEELKTFLEKFDLWDELAFGLYAIKEESA